jgi:peptide deformylase
MALLQILEFPDPRLRIRAQPVTQVDASLRELVDDMFETMYAAPGIGLAATQVNVAKRLLVLDISEKRDQPLVLINPDVVAREGVEETEEGLLAVCIQHEIDHLDGKLFVDYLSELKRTRIRKKLEKERKERPGSARSAPKAL